MQRSPFLRRQRASRPIARTACGALLAGAALVGPLLLGACGAKDDHPPPLSGRPSSGGSGSIGGTGGDECEGPPEPDAQGLCGNEVVPVVQEKPNLYFVLDSSGSMSLDIEGGGTRIGAAKTAITNLLHELGHRIRYGLATYPGERDNIAGTCATGKEVFKTQEGDPVQCVNKRVAGPVLTSFAKALSNVGAFGGTPTAATLEVIMPVVTQLQGQTFVVLLTDGAPNCSLDTDCGVDECMPNIESLYWKDVLCDDQFNCCDPELVMDLTAPMNCVDRSGVLEAVTALADLGVKTYVVGVPGSEYYADLLDQLAIAGGTAREGEARAYYPVSDSSSLAQVLKTIGSSVATSCDITLQRGSYYDPETINVYFDATLVPSSSDDGWTFESPTITLHGESCDKLLAGEVVQVQVIAGCPTVIK